MGVGVGVGVGVDSGVASAETNFSTGSDSPVMADCATNKSRAVSTRQSAGIMSPADSATKSPGTTWRSGISRRVAAAVVAEAAGGAPGPSRRITVAVLPTRLLSDSAARLARPSCTKRMPVLRATITPMTTVARTSPVNHDTPASTVSSRLNGFL